MAGTALSGPGYTRHGRCSALRTRIHDAGQVQSSLGQVTRGGAGTEFTGTGCTRQGRYRIYRHWMYESEQVQSLQALDVRDRAGIRRRALL